MDLIQSEYAWCTDEVLLNKPLCWVRQKIELISQRRLEDHRFIARVAEWSAKNISATLIGLAEDKSQAKAMSKMVEKMRLPLSDEINEVEDNRSIEEIIEQGAKVDLELQPGFESLSSALGHMK